MVPAIHPVSMTILPPLPGHRRPQGSVASVPPVPAVPEPEGFVRTIEPASRPHRDGASTRQDGLARDERPADQRAGRDFALMLEGLLALHAFAGTRGLTLNRHPEMTSAYSQAQALADAAHNRLDLNI